MKTLVTILSLLTISSTVFAAGSSNSFCNAKILQMAQRAINQEAVEYYSNYGMEFGHIKDSSLRIIQASRGENNERLFTVSVKGSIYVENYDVQVTVNPANECQINSINLIHLQQN